MSDIQKLRFYTDESGTPYEDGENPFPRTKEDDDFDQMMIEKYNLVLREEEGQRNSEMLQQITNKLGFNIRSYNLLDKNEAHERDNIPNPFDKLSLEELLFLREHNYFL